MSGTEKKDPKIWTKLDRFLWNLHDLGGSYTKTVEELQKYFDVTDMLFKDLELQLKHPVLYRIKTILRSSIVIFAVLTFIKFVYILFQKV